MGAYRLLTCSIIIDHHCLYLLETSIVVSRSCTWNVVHFVTYVKSWFVELFIITVITNFKLHLQLFKFTKGVPRIICHEFRYCRFWPTSSTTERRHTITCTMGAYRLLTCSIIIDHHCLYLFETPIVVSRSCTWNVVDFVTCVKSLIFFKLPYSSSPSFNRLHIAFFSPVYKLAVEVFSLVVVKLFVFHENVGCCEAICFSVHSSIQFVCNAK